MAEEPDAGQELHVARKRYELALANLRLAEGVYNDLDRPHPDGTEVLRNANHEFSAATEEFRRALQKFSDSVLRKSRASSNHRRTADTPNQ